MRHRYLCIFAVCFLCHWCNVIYCQDWTPTPMNESDGSSTSAELPTNLSSSAIRQAFETAGKIIGQQGTIVVNRGPPMNQQQDSASNRHDVFQRSDARSQLLEKRQQIFEEATKVLANEFNLTQEQTTSTALEDIDLQSILPGDTVEECEQLFNVTDCRCGDKYRSYDGTCNNLERTSLGMAPSCFERLMTPVYSDGISELRLSVSGRPLPTPRTISLEIHGHMNYPTHHITHFFMQWGQFLAHDISLSPLAQGANNQNLNCCPVEADNPPQCRPIVLKRDDPFYSKFGIDCLNNVRTAICATCTLGARQQTNQVTAFIDASHIYGISTNESNSLRNLDSTGTLRSDNSTSAGELLPPSQQPNNDGCSFQVQDETCFGGGDQRINQHLALTSLHTVFLRDHNRIAEQLRTLNPGWNGQRVFQETRRIVGAQMQMITYKEFLPLAIGRERMAYFDLNVQRSTVFTQYDQTVNPMLVNEFSTAAYRFGHSTINSFFPEISKQTNTLNLLRNLFLYPFDLYLSGRLEAVVRGLFESPAQKFDRYMVPDVTNHLYQLRGNHSGLDLASLNVFRGRDHGIPPYVEVVKYCGGPDIVTFRQLDLVFRRGYRKHFQKVYESVEDIDLFSGGLAERPNHGAVIGPTLACIVGIQFHNLKYGDRFYFEHGNQAGSFTKQQLVELKKITLAKIICDNADINLVQRKVLIKSSNKNPQVPCQSLPAMDLQAWSE